MHLRRSAVGAALGLALFASSIAAASAADLAAHRALYQLTLGNARSGDIEGATGTMAYEVTDACDAWAVRQRLQMTITNRDGQDVEMVSDYTTWESKDGLKLRFRMRQTTDTAVTSEVSGDADLTKTGGPGEIHYTLPKEDTMSLPAGTVFPTAHTSALLAAAAAGKKFLNLPLFDGTSADGVEDSSIVVTQWGPSKPTKWVDLSKLASGNFRIAFFDRATKSQEPDYEVGMRYWENGVADDLSMDFGEFVMNGKMTEFKLQKPAC